MSPGVITFTFEPIVRLGDIAVRLDTIAIAASVLVALIIAALVAGRTPAGPADPGRFVHGPRLRRDDLLFVVLGIVPGAVVAGRLGHAVLHADYYLANPGALLDPARGSIELASAVAGGALSGAYVARLLAGSVGRWLHVAAIPTIAVIGLGKLATALGGSGQGLPSDLPWATAYAGAGPWGSLAPSTPSHPSQIYEAIVALVVLALLAALSATGRFERRDGRAFLVVLAAWGLGRVAVGFTWRDDAVLGALNAGQLIALAVAAASIGLAIVVPRRRAEESQAEAVPSWPDPATRPRF